MPPLPTFPEFASARLSAQSPASRPPRTTHLADSPQSDRTRVIRRGALEFFVILASILAAFGLEAWWNYRVEADDTAASLQNLSLEFESTRTALSHQVGLLESARTALAALLPAIGPSAPLVPMDSVTTLFDLSFRASTIELQSGALQALLASGQLSKIEDLELATMLAAWPADIARLRARSSMLEENREIIIDYLHDILPTLQIAEKTGQMSRYRRSSFDVSTRTVQRDMRVEGLLGNRGMLIEDTDEMIQDLDARAVRILELIGRSLAR